MQGQGGGYEGSRPLGRPGSSHQGLGHGQVQGQGFLPERPLRPLPHTVHGTNEVAAHLLSPASQTTSFIPPLPQNPTGQPSYRSLPPPPIQVAWHTMPSSHDMYGGTGAVFPSGTMSTVPSTLWTNEDVWAGQMHPPPNNLRGSISQDSSRGGAPLLSPAMIPLPAYRLASLQSPTDTVILTTSNVLPQGQAPSSAHSSNGMFNYTVDHGDRLNAVTAYFSPSQRMPEAGPSSARASTSIPMNRYGQRLSDGSIGGSLHMTSQEQGELGETASNWLEGDDRREGEEMLVAHDDELEDEDDEGETDDRPRKKQRNSLRRGTACVRCRSKKLKCTGERPVCSVCQYSRKPVECVYQPMAKRKLKTHRLRSRLQELEDQIREKETQLNKLDDPGPETPMSSRSKLETISEEPNATAFRAEPQDGKIGLSDPEMTRESTLGSGLNTTSNVSNMLQMQAPSVRSRTVPSGLALDTGETAKPDYDRGVGETSNRLDNWLAAPRPEGSSYQQPDPGHIGSNLTMNRLSASNQVHGQGLSFGPGTVTVAPSSPVEYALIYAVLPYSLHFGLRVHPARFLDSILSVSTRRPHPALLYALFTASIYVLVNKLPHPPEAMSLPSRFPRPEDSIYPMLIDLESSFYSRAKTELDLGIQAGEQMDDVTKASTGLAKYLLLTGRVLEAVMLPFCRLAVACGLHRIDLSQPGRAGQATAQAPPEGSSGRDSTMTPLADATTDQPRVTASAYDRPKLVIVPPAQDSVSLWERIETFWAMKELDWGTSLLFGWSCGLADTEIQTAWPKRFEDFTSDETGRHDPKGVWDLMSSKSQTPRESLDPRILALQSLSLVSSANRLFDLPTPLSTIKQSKEPQARHPYTAGSLKRLQGQLEAFRSCLPDINKLPETISSDPWWIFTRANVTAADVLFYAGSAVHESAMYEFAVIAARRMVELMREIPVDLYAHLNCFVFVDVSLVARFLYREARRLREAGMESKTWQAASSDADLLLQALEDKAGKWHPFGLYLAEDVRRVKQGQRERPELYERTP